MVLAFRNTDFAELFAQLIVIRDAATAALHLFDCGEEAAEKQRDNDEEYHYTKLRKQESP